MTLQLAEKYGGWPWELTGEKLTRWGRMVWRYRMELYLEHQNSRQQREIEELRNR